MSPILVRPVREQLEHDRVIRLLQAKYKRRYGVGVNLGSEQSAPAGAGPDAQFPDLVLSAAGAGKRLAAVVEVETAESVNQLEAMAEWARFGKLPVDFALYVPVGAAGVARRLCADHHIGVTEIWTYHAIGDQVRFAQVDRFPLKDKLAAARAAAAEVRRAEASGEAGAAPPQKKPSGRARPAAKKTSPRATSRPAAAKRAASKKR